MANALRRHGSRQAVHQFPFPFAALGPDEEFIDGETLLGKVDHGTTLGQARLRRQRANKADGTTVTRPSLPFWVCHASLTGAGDWGSPLASEPSFQTLEEAQGRRVNILRNSEALEKEGCRFEFVIEETESDGSIVKHSLD